MDFQLSSIITLGSGLPFNIGGRGPGLKPDWDAAYPEKHAVIIPAWMPNESRSCRELIDDIRMGYLVS
jgi:hypothetical protein